VEDYTKILQREFLVIKVITTKELCMFATVKEIKSIHIYSCTSNSNSKQKHTDGKTEKQQNISEELTDLNHRRTCCE